VSAARMGAEENFDRSRRQQQQQQPPARLPEEARSDRLGPSEQADALEVCG
jgi:hypothetical protein